MQRDRLSAALALLCLTASFNITYGQSTFGTILGTVKDSTGQSIPSAAVQVQSAGQNTRYDFKTAENGDFQATNLQPGNYTLTIRANGFDAYVANNIRLDARQSVRLDVTLQVGTVEQRVDVEASAGVIATDTATVTSALGNERIVNLPVNYRASGSNSAFQLIATLPGVQSNNSAASGASFSINGALPGQASYSVDGITMQSPRGGGALADTYPSAEGLAEIKVQGVGNNAEYAGVADVTAVTRGGANAFHGAGFWYYQNSDFNATPYGATSKPVNEVNLAGFHLSGPVWLPKIYNGTNRTFFSTSFEGRLYPLQSVIQNTVPTAAMRAGDFSQEKTIINDPTTNAPFANNTIPTSRISPIATKFLSQLYPLPNFGATATYHTTNYVTNKTSDRPSTQFDVRIDQVISSKQNVFFRYSRKDVSAINARDLLIDSTTSAPEDRSFVVSYNYAIRPNLLNEFRVGYAAETQNSNFQNFDGAAFTKSLGFNGLPPLWYNGLPELNFNNFTGVGVDRVQGSDTYSNLQFNNNVTWIKGGHTFKMGIDLRRSRSKTALGFSGADNYGTYGFNGTFTGYDFSDFLLGAPYGSSLSNVIQDNDGRAFEYHAFAQDSWRVNQRLTVEYGVRWQHIPPFTDEAGYIGNFDRSVARTGRVLYPTGDLAASKLAPALLLAVNACPGTPNLPANNLPGLAGVPCTPFVTASQSGYPEGLRIDYKYNFYPRLGVAYRLNDKTSIRSSFGVFQMPMRGGVFYSLTGTAQTDVRTYNNIGANGQPVFTWPNVTTGGSGISVSSSSYGTSYFGTANATDLKNPYQMQWSLTIDRAIGFGTGLRLSYIGSKSTQLPWAPNLNQSWYSTQFYSLQPLQSRPFPYWGRIESRDTGGNAEYGAFQAEVNRRFQKGLAFTAAYTWAKNLNDIGGPNPSDFGSETGNGRVLDSNNRAMNRGNDYATRRHRMISNFVYELPFGHGRAFAPQTNRLVDALIGGWQVSGIFLLQSGPWMTPSQGSNGDPSGTGAGTYRTQRPDLIGNPLPSNQTRDVYLDKNAFACAGRAAGALQFNCGVGLNPAKDIAPIGRFGNSGVGIVQGPGTVNLSAGIAKYFRITERLRGGVESTWTNVLNHTNLADPNLNITSSGFGRITSARAADYGGSRTGQIAIRLQF